jgi:hypothetical protein
MIDTLQQWYCSSLNILLVDPPTQTARLETGWAYAPLESLETTLDMLLATYLRQATKGYIIYIYIYMYIISLYKYLSIYIYERILLRVCEYMCTIHITVRIYNNNHNNNK